MFQVLPLLYLLQIQSVASLEKARCVDVTFKERWDSLEHLARKVTTVHVLVYTAVCGVGVGGCACSLVPGLLPVAILTKAQKAVWQTESTFLAQ